MKKVLNRKFLAGFLVFMSSAVWLFASENLEAGKKAEVQKFLESYYSEFGNHKPEKIDKFYSDDFRKYHGKDVARKIAESPKPKKSKVAIIEAFEKNGLIFVRWDNQELNPALKADGIPYYVVTQDPKTKKMLIDGIIQSDPRNE